ncbi:MAG: GAF domain-containing protein [Armatimonadota bacterium]
MSHATGKNEALKELADLICSGKPPLEVLERVLDAGRRASGAICLSLVAEYGDAGSIRSMTVQAEGAGSLAAACAEAGALACFQPDTAICPDGLCFTHLASSNGRSAVLVSDSDVDKDSLCLVSGIISLVYANEQLSAALDTAKRQTNKRIAEVAAVYEIGQAINELDIERLLPLITEKAAAVMDAQACSLLLRDPESDDLTIEASWGLTDDIVKGARVHFGEGISGRVAKTGEAMLLVDIRSDPRFKTGSVRPRKGIASSMSAPLKDESGRVIGVLNIRRHVPAPVFTEDELRLFCVFASQAALAISNAQLYMSLSQRIAEMSTISDLLRAINSTLDLSDVLDQVADNIIKVVGFDRCCVYLFDSRANEYIAGIRRGYEDGELPSRVGPGVGTIGLAAKECIAVFDKGNRRKQDGGHRLRSKGQQSFLATPIVVRGQCIGVVVVDNAITDRPVNQSEVELLSTFVSQAGIAIENARLYEAMEEKYSELNVLFEHSKTISSAYGLENVAHISTAVARKAVPCDSCALLLLSGKRTNIALQATAGVPQNVIDYVRRRVPDEKVVEFVRDLRSASLVGQGNSACLGKTTADIIGNAVGESGSALLVPLLAEDVTIGAFVLIRQDSAEFTTGEVQLLSIVASQAAVVLKNALRYEQRMKRQVLDLSTLYDFSRRISASASLEEALDVILGIVNDLVDCDESVIYAIDHERDVMVPTSVRLSSGGVKRASEQPLSGNSVMSWTVRERKAIVSPDISCDSRFDPIEEDAKPVRSLMSIPLMVQDEAVGVLCVRSASPNLYSEDDVRMLSIIASQSTSIYKELEALAALTSYTENILSSIAAGVVTLDSNGVVLTWNRAAESITGLKSADMEGSHYRDVIARLTVTDTDKASTVQIIDKVRATGEVYQGYKLCYHPAKEDVRYVNISASVLWNHNGDPIGQVIIFEDTTKDIKMENEFRRMGELAAVGQLAASIAHELRNPLSSIKGAAQFLRKEYEDNDSTIVEFLDIIIEEVNGLSKLTTEFLEFARPMEFEIGPVDINGIVRKTLQLMNVHISESGVVVQDHLAMDLPVIQADGKQLEQVLRNIILNAVQAMPDGGSLSIETSATCHAVELSVSDTGIGIPEEKLDRIFVPFFTTKTKGTGLGLSVVKKIVENHGGYIDVSSVVGQGTRFKVILPLAGIVRAIPPEAETTERKQ